MRYMFTLCSRFPLFATIPQESDHTIVRWERLHCRWTTHWKNIFPQDITSSVVNAIHIFMTYHGNALLSEGTLLIFANREINSRSYSNTTAFGILYMTMFQVVLSVFSQWYSAFSRWYGVFDQWYSVFYQWYQQDIQTTCHYLIIKVTWTTLFWVIL